MRYPAKGQFEVVPNMFIIVIGLIGVFILVVLVYANIGTSARIQERNINSLNAIDATHIIEHCLKNGKDAIEMAFLEENEGENACEICGICEIQVEFKVEDIETAQIWKFDYSRIRQSWKWFVDKVKFWKDGAHTEDSILVSIRTGDGIHIGRLYVWV